MHTHRLINEIRRSLLFTFILHNCCNTDKQVYDSHKLSDFKSLSLKCLAQGFLLGFFWAIGWFKLSLGLLQLQLFDINFTKIHSGQFMSVVKISQVQVYCTNKPLHTYPAATVIHWIILELQCVCVVAFSSCLFFFFQFFLCCHMQLNTSCISCRPNTSRAEGRLSITRAALDTSNRLQFFSVFSERSHRVSVAYTHGSMKMLASQLIRCKSKSRCA